MLLLKWALIALAVLVALAILAGQSGMLSGKAPTDLGVRDGKLKGLSATPNCVSSQAQLYPDHPQRKYAEIAALTLRGDGPATLSRLQNIVAAMGGVKVVESKPDYLYAQFTTPLMKYVDDVEFWFDPAANVIQVRSASRVGRSDLGLNRKRVEAIRADLISSP